MRNIFLYTMRSLLLLIIATCVLQAQITSIQLQSSDSSSSFQLLDNNNARLMRINADGGFYLSGTNGTGVIPATGAGTRLMWYPAKSAFRSGYVNTQWDDSYVGQYSVAMGGYTVASGSYSLATGYASQATGTSSIAMGYSTNATGLYSTAVGMHTIASGTGSLAGGGTDTASGNYSVALGQNTKATEDYSVALCRSTVASGMCSFATGYYTTASGYYSTAMGNVTTASGTYSVAMGNSVSTNGFNGSFIFGDQSTFTETNSTAHNQMTMRFAGGFILYTDDDLSNGAFLDANANAWQTISDIRKKENLVKTDGEYFLNGLSQLNLGSWNYIGQDPRLLRHYGPMAQEIYRYFGKDIYGIIGNDTTLNTADMDGIMMICLQALEKRTSELQKANEKIVKLEQMISEQNVKMQVQQTSFDELKTDIAKIKNDINSLTSIKDEKENNITLNK